MRAAEIGEIADCWQRCKLSAIPAKYFKDENKPFIPFLEQHLHYLSENPACSCYWPHRSKEAQKINSAVCNTTLPMIISLSLKGHLNNVGEGANKISEVDQLFYAYVFLLSIWAGYLVVSRAITSHLDGGSPCHMENISNSQECVRSS